ncbi:MAG: uracil-DNA glycosylase [Planctomycetota bacterium]|jgi:DNA polymerase
MNDESMRQDPEAARDDLYLRLEAELAFGVDRIARASTGAEALEGASVLADLEEKARACRACPLCEERNKVVFGVGNPRAELMFVGEAPGVDEDRVGEPFVGRAGQLLTRMIQAMGQSRETVYIANVVKCHPRGNRTPGPREIEACRPFLEAQIRTISPRVIVALGAPASQTLLNRGEGISTLRGHAYPYDKVKGVTLVPTFHPAYLLRNESEKNKAWEDLQRAMAILEQDAE